MTPEFNEWWDADDLLEENPYDIGKPICWAWEGWQAARRREWVGLTDEDFPDNLTNEFKLGARWASARLKEKNHGQ
jgi:hypothetical protein